MERKMINFEEVDFADEMLRRIEKDYGRSVQRIAKFNKGYERNSFLITIVFTDHVIFEGKIKIYEIHGEAMIKVEGAYY